MTKTPIKWTEAMVFQALRKKYPTPSYTLLPQVRNCTGSIDTRRVRTADAIVVSTWPSLGLWLGGIEIKVSRSDWKKELADPSKSAAIQKYCRFWNIAAPKGIVPVDEVPENWGLLEIGRRGVHQTKTAPPLKEEPPDMLFLAAVLRRAGEVERDTRELRERVKEESQKYSEARKKLWELESLAERVKVFEEKSGVSINSYQAGSIGRAVRLVREVGLTRCVAQATELRDMASQIERDLGWRWIAWDNPRITLTPPASHGRLLTSLPRLPFHPCVSASQLGSPSGRAGFYSQRSPWLKAAPTNGPKRAEATPSFTTYWSTTDMLPSSALRRPRCSGSSFAMRTLMESAGRAGHESRNWPACP